MKTYSIGRDMNCDIVINDSTDVVSRRHALLNVTSTGKMTIIDQSSNGTYVNGIRISSNVPVPVSRKDTVSLAHVAKLDWSLVPKSNIAMRYGMLGIIGVLIVVGIFFGIKFITEPEHLKMDNSQEVVVDSAALKKAEQIRLDSLNKAHIKDSLRRDSMLRVMEQQKAAKEKKVKDKKKEGKNAASSGQEKNSKKKTENPVKSKQDVG